MEHFQPTFQDIKLAAAHWFSKYKDSKIRNQANFLKDFYPKLWTVKCAEYMVMVTVSMFVLANSNQPYLPNAICHCCFIFFPQQAVIIVMEINININVWWGWYDGVAMFAIIAHYKIKIKQIKTKLNELHKDL